MKKALFVLAFFAGCATAQVKPTTAKYPFIQIRSTFVTPTGIIVWYELHNPLSIPLSGTVTCGEENYEPSQVATRVAVRSKSHVLKKVTIPRSVEPTGSYKLECSFRMVP